MKGRYVESLRTNANAEFGRVDWMVSNVLVTRKTELISVDGILRLEHVMVPGGWERSQILAQKNLLDPITLINLVATTGMTKFSLRKHLRNLLRKRL